MIYGKFIPLVLASSLLVACGDGDNGIGSSSAYTGKRELAALNTSNQNTFVAGLIFSLRDIAATGSRVDENAVIDVPSMMQRPEYLSRLIKRQVNNRYQAREVNLPEACSGGGFQTTTGNLDEGTNTGILRITSSQCSENDMVIDGVVDLIINEYDNYIKEPTDFIVITSDLSETINGVSYSVSGNIHFTNGAVGDAGIYGWEVKVISNLARKASTGVQQLDNNLQVEKDYNSSVSISGGFCDGSNGCVSIITKVPFYIPTQGEIVMTGANNSRIRIYPLDSQTWVGVDADGDGTYETNTPYTDPF
ncbi:hypothetical protein SAMN05660964_01450 [Thiothrix caldifontis]|uniref:Lipoprotein n=1 Tax=Thiothrix caldifontis TaxID=525918 RepID=A0A1H4AQ60_9GAMM|nr:hypothetical protein [Thiothrix caldifontis]SEA38043.1 hypothetical protein SAMN05660964_01450 [Thiothrix caldifontis]